MRVALHHRDAWGELWQGDVLDFLRSWPADSVHCIVTSPPYWGLRDYGAAGQHGLEDLHDCLGWATGEACGECYICRQRQVFQECLRILRPDGLAWVNLGDSFSNGWRKSRAPDAKFGPGRAMAVSLKPKDLALVPFRFALAMQAMGWWVRMDNVWSKPNAMPQSAQDRPAKTHEYVFMLAKAERYYFDELAVREPAMTGDHARNRSRSYQPPGHPEHKGLRLYHQKAVNGLERKRRSVWTINNKPFPGAHFATFPSELPEICIKAGTSEKGVCPHCGAPWEREDVSTGLRTTGWRPGCACPDNVPAPAVVLDPYFGAGTTGLVAASLRRRWLGCELSAETCELARRRLEGRTIRSAAEPAQDLPLLTMEASCGS